MQTEPRLLERSTFAVFNAHRRGCAACKLVDPERPATMSLACLTGAVSLKDALQIEHARSRRARR